MHIAILTNDHLWTYNLRKELVEEMLKKGHRVTLVLPYGEKIDFFKELGCDFVDFSFEGRGTNIFKEIILYKNYIKVLKQLKPDIVLTYTTKPNIYGASACAALKIPYIITITGTGRAMLSGISKKLMSFLYKVSSRKARCIVFQNSENMELFKDSKIYKGKCVLVPGSGVNTSYHNAEEYPPDGTIKFLFIGRLNAIKGIEDYITVAKKVKGADKNAEFHVVGMPENEYFENLANEAHSNGDIIYHGMLTDVRNIIKECHCTLHPSCCEGMANVLLESASAARPLITTDACGCRETVSDNETGFIFKVKDTDDCYEKVMKFLELSYEAKKEMGLKGREKMLNEFDRYIVAEKYMEIIENSER